MKYLKIAMMLIFAVSLVGVCSGAENENVSVVSVLENLTLENETPQTNVTNNVSNETIKDIPKEITFIKSVPEEKFHTNYMGRKTIVNESIHYFLEMKAFDAYQPYSGSNGDLHEDVLVVAYTNNTVKIFNMTNESEIIPQNGLKWRFSTGNYRCMTSHYTTMPSGGGSDVVDNSPSGVPDEIVYSTSVSDNFGLMQEIWAREDNCVIKVCERGTWDENTVRELREQYPTKKIIILEWYEGD